MNHGTEAVGFRKRRWNPPPTTHDHAAVECLARSTGCHPLIARLLLNRSIRDPEQARAFIHPEFRNLAPPETLPGMDQAAGLVAQAVSKREKITIFGDYDVDGITGTAMLWRLLQAAGASFDIYIPHRLAEGYGLSCEAVEQIAARSTSLLLTVDCGITALEPTAQARRRGMKVVITDHHEIGAQLPPADAIVHPALAESAVGNRNLCGAAIAYKLAWAIARQLCGSSRLTPVYRELLIEFTALVALATIADVMPLTGENRIWARYGLAHLPRCALAGVQALIGAAGWENRKIDGAAVGFSLAPRLNAAGRMGHAGEAFDLLTTDSPTRACQIAACLEKLNSRRQATERKITAHALETVRAMETIPPAIVLCEPHWHGGVLGIVAARMVDAFYRPTFIFTTEDQQTATGSGRSVEGFPLHEAIERCRDLLISGGGHAAAGGVRLPLANLDLFRQRLSEFAGRHMASAPFVPAIELDGALEESDLVLHAFEEMESLAPFGHGNPQPKFLLSGATIAAPPRRVGVSGAHLQLQLRLGGQSIRAVGFRMGELEPALPVGLGVDLVAEPHVDHYNGSRRLDMHMLDVARSDREPFKPAVPVQF